MANEISVSLSLSVSKGNNAENVSFGTLRFDQSNQPTVSQVTTVSTASAQTLSLGPVTTAGYAAFRNLSTATSGTAYVAIGSLSGTNFYEFAHLRRGQPAVVPLRGNVTLGALSYAASPVTLKYVVLSE